MSRQQNIASLNVKNVDDLHVEDRSTLFCERTKFSRETTSNKINIQDVIVYHQNSKMAKDSIDDILVRLDEVEKLQAELRHLVPRATSNSSRHVRHQDLSRDTSASIRFPSLFTFPVISNFTSSSSKNDRVQKSAAQLNLNDKLSKNNRSFTTNLKSARRSQRASARETNIFKNLSKSTDKSLARSHAGNSLASTSVGNSKTSMKDIVANRVSKNSQAVIKKELKNGTSKTASRDKTQCITGERSSMRLSESKDNSSK
ncbi:uncharacterized protein LOC114938436 [Nylanderia fulva]|uniref:uncharacterized protein LOC114938436 n=1 Tax=Nylanderia fulva TaxID=613905 RepID=UPI0010FB8D97|nr:uncharacterized protein LOC114938436 [Nylanderia fulva]